MIRWRPLLVLTAAVLAIHGWLLRPPPAAFESAAGARQRVLITRSLPVAGGPVEVPAGSSAPTAPKLAGPSASPAVMASLTPARPHAVAQQTVRRANPTASFAAVEGSSLAKAPSPLSPNAAENLAFTVPGSMLLHYKVTAHTHGLELTADGQLHWRHDGDEYEAKLELSGPLFSSRTQQSTGRVTAEGLAPLRFSDRARSEEAAHFNREEGKVSFSSNRPDAPLTAGAQDRLSVLMQLGAMIAAKPKNFGPGATISVQTASTREAEVWQFTVEGDEALQLPGGNRAALKLIRNPRKEFDQKIELWLAPAMDYVPVRLRLTQPNGDWIDQQWSSTDKG
jgi:hypothetical protein